MKPAQFGVWGLLENWERYFSALWKMLTGATKSLVVPARESEIRADSPRFSKRKAFSRRNSADGYLMFVENGLYRRMSLSKGVTTVGKSKGADCRVADSGEGCLEFIRQKNRYYVNVSDSNGGACLNGQKLPYNEMVELKPHDAIQFAQTTLTFFLRDASSMRQDANVKEAETL